MQTDDDVAPLPRSVRINQLFTTFHTASEPEQSATAVAQAVTVLTRRPVSAEEISALRAADHDTTPTDAALLAALAHHFQVPPLYLTGTDATATGMHKELRLLAAARDAGVRHLNLRGDDIDIDELTDELRQLAKYNPASPDQAN
ncbi:hypothetical protein [Nocardia sp. NPDC004860]|uniref:hypothetical protein n=1 Tax=Nocardia sp. NPDC004860 TaxID=3154557 RepID=UPI0033BF2C52